MTINITSGRTLVIDCKASEVKEYIEDNKIVMLELIKEKTIFKLNDYVDLNITEHKASKTWEEKFLIRDIQRSKNHLYVMCSSILTKAYHFILPCLRGTISDFSAFGYLQNVYYDKGEISLLYRDSEQFCMNAYRHIRDNRFFKYEKMLPHLHRLLVVTLPDNRTIEERCYLEGRYSELPDPYKKKIKEFFALDDKSDMWLALFKDEKLHKKMEKELAVKIPHKSELISKPRPEEEIFRLEMINVFNNEKTTTTDLTVK